jgi:ribosomal-protein-alanine N-acetyltransferase
VTGTAQERGAAGGPAAAGAPDAGTPSPGTPVTAGTPGPGAPRAPVTLRAMRWWDLDAVLALEHELFPEDAWSRAMFWSELAEARHPAATRTYVVAQDPDGRLVGYAGLAAIAGTGDVQTIAVARDHWGTGLGARLLTTLLHAATDAECHEVLLEVRVDNARAQRLYRRFGFEPIGFRKGYYQPGNVDALVMRLADPAAAPTAGDPPGVQETGIHG